MTDDREPFREARDRWKAQHHDQRVLRAQTVLGEWDHQAIVQPIDGLVRLRVADDTGESFVAVMLTPEGTERLAAILLQAKAQVEASA